MSCGDVRGCANRRDCDLDGAQLRRASCATCFLVFSRHHLGSQDTTTALESLVTVTSRLHCVVIETNNPKPVRKASQLRGAWRRSRRVARICCGRSYERRTPRLRGRLSRRAQIFRDAEDPATAWPRSSRPATGKPCLSCPCTCGHRRRASVAGCSSCGVTNDASSPSEPPTSDDERRGASTRGPGGHPYPGGNPS